MTAAQFKKSFCLLALIPAFLIAFGQSKLTSNKWMDDLSYLQSRVHKDYAHLFQNVTARQWDSSVGALKRKIPSLSEVAIKVEFIRLIAMFRVGHTGVRFMIGEDEKSLQPMFHYYPMTIYPFSDGIFIKSIHTKYKEALGGKITKIGNDDIETVLKKMREVIPWENEQYFKGNLPHYLRLPELLYGLKIAPNPNVVELTYTIKGATKHISIHAEAQPDNAWHNELQLPAGWVDLYKDYNTSESALWLKKPGKLRYMEYIPALKTVYVRHSAVADEPDESIATFFRKSFDFIDSNDVEKLVLDIRLNGGGNNYLNKPIITGIIQSKINRYGQLFVITGASTFSAAQNLTNELEKYTEAIFVGEPTAENVNFWGDVKTEVLPNSKLNIVLSWLWWQNMDPRDKRQWTSPDLAASMCVEDYKTGFDSALHIITNYKKEIRVEERITKLVAEGKMEEASAITIQFTDDPLHRFCKNELEAKLSENTSSMLRTWNQANHLLKINGDRFPVPAPINDSYIEDLWRQGRIEEAIMAEKIQRKESAFPGFRLIYSPKIDNFKTTVGQ